MAYSFADEPRRPPGRSGSDDYYHPGSGTQEPGNGGGSSGGGGGPGDTYNPCSGQSEWVPMPVEDGYPNGGYYRCIGPASGGGGGGGYGGFSYDAPTFGGSKRPQYSFDPAPMFDAPEFQAPDPQGIYSDPSYEFRFNEGLRALENSAAAGGVTRTGANLKGIQAWGQQFASQEFSNVFDRALQAYDREYRGAFDEFQPRFREWEVLTGAEQRAADLAWQREWDEWVFRINDEFRREEMIFNAGAYE